MDSRGGLSSNFQSEEDREQFNYESDDDQPFDDQSDGSGSRATSEDEEDHFETKNEALEQVARAEADIRKQKQALSSALEGIPKAQQE
mmetsp:Transcript_5019/g.7547  ORF Transcript_5019/g.7547 Transcript_5019/m.7547 type:complete len:88 (+) Transcript_5019:6068-6331(+)